MEIREGGAFDGGIVAGAGERDDAFLSGVGVDDQTLEPRRDDFVFFCEQKNRGDMDTARVSDAVQIGRDFLRHWAGEQPQVPPAELPQDNLPQRWRIVQDQAGDLSVRGDL
jgi:hypothetical protein